MKTNFFNTHIVGKSGTGKTFFASNKAASLLKEGKKVLYVTWYEDYSFPEASSLVVAPPAGAAFMLSNNFDDDNFKYEDLEKTVKDFVQTNSSAKIIIPDAKIGPDRAEHVSRLLADVILNNKEFFADYFIFIDEINKFDDSKIQKLLSESKESRISLFFTHQYMGQFSDELSEIILRTCKNIIFQISPSDSSLIASIVNTDSESLEKIKSYEYREFDPVN